MSVVVFGSINMDLVVRTERLPRPGETVEGRSFRAVPGGKGANQAVATARLGAPTRMVGRVGDDAFGRALIVSLTRDGVQVDGVAVGAGEVSGVALIEVDDAGENRIVAVPGANGSIGEGELKALDRALEGAELLLLQLEAPMPAVVAAAEAAARKGIGVILDPAPAQELPASLARCVRILTPNASELESLVGLSVDDASGIRRAAQMAREWGVGDVVVKMGVEGVYWAGGNQFLTAFPVRAIDTVGAGDAFNGALAVALTEGRPMLEALRWAMAAGALATTRAGAQDAMPTRTEVETLLTESVNQ